jgi:hypothetical protein
MSIFPLVNYYVTNVEVSKASSFKSGMCLVRDANGNAVVADRAAVFMDSVNEQLGRFLGFASGDHDVANNIILSDPVGSNYIDSNNNFIDRANSHFSSVKRSILDFADENVGRFYNIFDNSVNSKRGVGVYNLEGEIYITDQYATKLAMTYGGDSIIDIVFSPGDLLTFGAGVNAGKLVKVDTSGSGPSVLIVGAVEKFDAGSNVLYFRHALEAYSNVTSYSTTGLYMNLDASSATSYPGSGTTWFDLSGNNINGQIRNGAFYTSDSGGVINLDGTDDDVFIDYNALMVHSGDFTIEVVYYSTQKILTAFFARPTTYGTGNRFAIGSFLDNSPLFWNPLLSVGGQSITGVTPMNINNWYSMVATRNSGTLSLYLNGRFENSAYDTTDYTSTRPVRLSYWAYWVCAAKIASVRMYSVGMSAAEIQANHNAIYQRLVN